MTLGPPSKSAGLTPGRRIAVAGRYLLITGVLIAVVGVVGHDTSRPLLTATLGPTAYVFAAHPDTETARFRNAALGHAVAIAAALGALAGFGLWHHPPMTATGEPALTQVAAAAIAVGVTLAVLELIRAHHAPAAATAVLVTTGLAQPGRPLVGLVVGLAIVIAVGPLSGRIPFARAATERETAGPAPAPAEPKP